MCPSGSGTESEEAAQKHPLFIKSVIFINHVCLCPRARAECMQPLSEVCLGACRGRGVWDKGRGGLGQDWLLVLALLALQAHLLLHRMGALGASVQC